MTDCPAYWLELVSDFKSNFKKQIYEVSQFLQQNFLHFFWNGAF